MVKRSHTLGAGLLVSTLLLAGNIASAAAARVLLPISTGTTNGGYGSQWVTEVWANNCNRDDVTIGPLALSDFRLQGGEIVRLPIFRPPNGQPPGQFLIMSKEQAPLVRINLRTRNIASGSETFGTEIPTVREHEFIARQTLINIPGDRAGARGLLRIYSLPGEVPRTILVTIRVRTQHGTTLAERHVVINEPLSFYLPGYAELSLQELLGDETVPAHEVLTIDVEAFPEDRLWCFLSIVSNTSQHITTITP